jgi:hypothetical protein
VTPTLILPVDGVSGDEKSQEKTAIQNAHPPAKTTAKTTISFVFILPSESEHAAHLIE